MAQIQIKNYCYYKIINQSSKINNNKNKKLLIYNKIKINLIKSFSQMFKFRIK
jgi:hypothetical protein